MEKSRYVKGLENLSAVDGSGGEAVIKSLEDISPDLGKYIIEFAFGDIYSGRELSLQEREAVTLASLLTLGGCEPQLEVHIIGALNTGIPPEKLLGFFYSAYPTPVFRKFLTLFLQLKKFFQKEGLLFKIKCPESPLWIFGTFSNFSSKAGRTPAPL